MIFSVYRKIIQFCYLLSSSRGVINNSNLLQSTLKPNLIVIWAYDARKKHYYFHYAKYLTKILRSYNHIVVDTTCFKNKVIDVEKLRQEYFGDCGKTMLFFPSGSWIGNSNNYLVNHKSFVKILDIEDQKNEKQLNEMIKPYGIHYVLYRYESSETDVLKDSCKYIVREFFHWPHFTDQKIFYDRKLNKNFDVCFYGNYDEQNYPFRFRLRNILKRNCGIINTKFLEREDGFFEEKLSVELNKSWLAVATPVGHHDRFVNKYQEIVMSGTCVLGEFPSRHRNETNNNYVEVNHKMTDSEIISTILDALKTKDRIAVMANELKNIYVKKYNTDVGENMFNGFIQSIVSDC